MSNGRDIDSPQIANHEDRFVYFFPELERMNIVLPAPSKYWLGNTLKYAMFHGAAEADLTPRHRSQVSRWRLCLK